MKVAGYEELMLTLTAAYEQASGVKGKERHARGKPFHKQPIMEIARMVGPGYPTGQAMKKLQKAVGMMNRNQLEEAQAEALGAINYAAAFYILLGEMRAAKS
jgi:hypothetical protein